MDKNTTITIDLAKEVFQIAVFNQAGKSKLNKSVSAKKLKEIVDQYPHAKIYMEACGSAHYWARLFQEQGHFVGLIPAQVVARYRQGNKNDKNDAIAIFEASKSEQVKLVAIRTLEQQDIALMHTLREGYKKARNQIANRIRGFAFEYGICFPVGIAKLKKQLPEVLEDAENSLTPLARKVLNSLQSQLTEINELYDESSKDIQVQSQNNAHCKRLQKVPGIGWLIASMLYAKLGQGDGFEKGRDVSAMLGLVPSHSGTGGKIKIGSITKKGDTYIRAQLVNGARAVVSKIRDKQDELSCWIRGLLGRKSFNTTVVAVANKLARVAFAILKSGEPYKPTFAK
ncbi:IS110 family transposase [Algibacillus agarilyticus]|uniref:IS110 family transposase n=1 Tax=Algibacillus agarilyticus TaxID=2234133 RepID=UPI000DCFC847|nr:IS110 family transposase [Algibacillus agarilyticus]